MAAQAPAIGYVSLLRTYPRFRNLWIANIISLLGDWLDAMALAEVAIGLTSRPGSPLTAAQALTAMMLARLLPIFLLSPIAGNAADRFPRIKVMQVCNLISAACVLLFLPFLTTEGLPVVLLLLFVKLGALTFFAPAYQAAVPVIVPHEHLQQANALGITTFSAMTALGGSLGGLAVHHLGVQPALVFDAVTFLVANVFLVRVTLPPSPLAETRPQPVKDFMAGLHFLRATPLVLPALLLAPLLDASGSGVIGPLLAEHAWPHRRPDGSLAIGLVSGLIYTAFGLGSVLGPIYVQKLRATPPSMQRIIPGALVVQGIFLAVLGLAGPFWLGLTGAALSASARALVWIYSATLLQLQVPNQYRGRVSSVQIALIGLCDLISALLVQAALDRGWLDVRGVTVALGTYSMVVGGLYLVLGRIPLAPIVSDTAAPPSDPAPA